MTEINQPQPHLNDSIREINTTAWLISNTFLLTHSSSSPPPPPPPPDHPPTEIATWSDSKEGHFALTSAPTPLPDSKPLTEDPSSWISLVHAVPNQSAVWRAGEAFIKAHHIDHPHTTREHVTLQFLKEHQPQGFDFPEVYHHFETAGPRYFLVVSRVHGQVLEDAWRDMDETLRRYYIDKVAGICHYLATAWKCDRICGVDGHQLLERYLIKSTATTTTTTTTNNNMADDDDDALSPQHLLKNCTEMSMDTSTPFVFYHCDLGPTNLLVDVSTGSLGIIDWEIAGYVPREWVRTKFRLSAGMDFSFGDGDQDQDQDARKEWRRGVARRLGSMGYRDVVDEWWGFLSR